MRSRLSSTNIKNLILDSRCLIKSHQYSRIGANAVCWQGLNCYDGVNRLQSRLLHLIERAFPVRPRNLYLHIFNSTRTLPYYPTFRRQLSDLDSARCLLRIYLPPKWPFMEMLATQSRKRGVWNCLLSTRLSQIYRGFPLCQPARKPLTRKSNRRCFMSCETSLKRPRRSTMLEIASISRSSTHLLRKPMQTQNAGDGTPTPCKAWAPLCKSSGPVTQSTWYKPPRLLRMVAEIVGQFYIHVNFITR